LKEEYRPEIVMRLPQDRRGTLSILLNDNVENFIYFYLRHSRVFYHSRVGLPLADEEQALESDDDVDVSWETSAAHRFLEEFADVSFEEKEFMSLWRNHVASFPVYADMYVALVCERFAGKHAP
jgi:hypothetical protein